MSIVVLPFIALLVVLSYHYHKDVGEHKLLMDSQKQFAYIKALNSLLLDIDEERRVTTEYLNSSEKNISNELQEIQKSVDKAIVDLKNGYSGQMSENLLKNFANLDNTRRKFKRKDIKFEKLFVDESTKKKPEHKDIKFEKLFFVEYAKGFSCTIKNEMDRAKKKIDIQNINNNFYHYIEIVNPDIFTNLQKSKPSTELLNVYLELIRAYENTVVERDFISHKITTRSSLSDSDLEIWNKLIAKDNLPGLDVVRDYTSFDKFINSNNADKKLFEKIDLARMEVIFGSPGKSAGESQNDKWVEAETEKLDNIFTKESFISLLISQNLTRNIIEKEKEMLLLLLCIGVLLILALSLFVLFGYYGKFFTRLKKPIEKFVPAATRNKIKTKKKNSSTAPTIKEDEKETDFIEHLSLPQ